MIRIRTYRAVDDLKSCEKFAEGHRAVLKSYGVPKVTSDNYDWFYNPEVYVIVAESISGKEIYGGVKIYVAGGTQPLPVEEAVGRIEKKIFDLVKQHSLERTGEICGLWNAREIAGQGFGILLIRSGIAKAGIVIANQLKLNSLFTLASPWTIETVKNIGFEVEKSLGNDGTFPYPTPDLLATVLILKDTETLKHATSREKEHIFDLRIHPQQKKMEIGPKGVISIEYDLLIPNLYYQSKPTTRSTT